MAQTKTRTTVTLDTVLVEELKRLADGMGTTLSGLLNMLLTIAINSTGQTFAAFGTTMESLREADAEHDSK